MFGWFQRLLPKSGDFFTLFERHWAATSAGAAALSQLIDGAGDRQSLLKMIEDREHDGDDVIRHVLRDVRHTFLTPFDRAAIVDLISAMDDVLDELHACATAIELYDFTAFEPDMKSMARRIVDAVSLIEGSLPLLRDITRSGPALHELTGKIVAIEGEVDGFHDRGLKTTFAEARGRGDAFSFLIAREIYKHLERVADAFEDVANEIDALAVDYA